MRYRLKGYIHTIDGRPGFFDGTVISLCDLRHPVRLANSLSQIKKEQRADRRFREAHAWRINDVKMGHLRVAAELRPKA